MTEPIKLTSEQEKQLAEAQELQVKINEANKVIHLELAKLGLTLVVDHVIRFAPIQKEE